jgi:hypothetical protein
LTHAVIESAPKIALFAHPAVDARPDGMVVKMTFHHFVSRPSRFMEDRIDQDIGISALSRAAHQSKHSHYPPPPATTIPERIDPPSHVHGFIRPGLTREY